MKTGGQLTTWGVDKIAARDAHAAVILTLWAPLGTDDRPVLDRAIQNAVGAEIPVRAGQAA